MSVDIVEDLERVLTNLYSQDALEAPIEEHAKNLIPFVLRVCVGCKQLKEIIVPGDPRYRVRRKSVSDGTRILKLLHSQQRNRNWFSHDSVYTWGWGR